MKFFCLYPTDWRAVKLRGSAPYKKLPKIFGATLWISLFGQAIFVITGKVHPAAARDHGRLERMGDKAKTCVPCLYSGRKVPERAKIRKPLLELSVNSTIGPPNKRIRRRASQRGIHGCGLCGIHICIHIACWRAHLEAIPCL